MSLALNVSHLRAKLEYCSSPSAVSSTFCLAEYFEAQHLLVSVLMASFATTVEEKSCRYHARKSLKNPILITCLSFKPSTDWISYYVLCNLYG
jgi:hypothetical protein